MRPLTTEKVTSSGSSAQSSAFSANIEYIRVIPDADCHIEFGVNHDNYSQSVKISKDTILALSNDLDG